MAFLVRRLLLTLPILFIVSVVCFSMINLIPGDPATVILGPEATEQAKEQMRERLNLNDPIPVQYVDWLGGVLRGDLGESLVDQTPVSQLILQRLPVTAELALGTFAVSLTISVIAGILSASRRGTWVDYLSTGVALGGISIPHFWLGMMFIIIFAVNLGWLPASGYEPLFQDPIANITAMILPVFATGLRESAELTRMLRSSLLEELGSDYVRTAFSKGLSRRVVVIRHAVRNALVPFVTASGLQIAGLLGGLVVTETVFQLPGLGRLVVDSIEQRDFTTVQGAVLTITVVVVLINVLVDVLYTFIDPRISTSSGG
ncbi:MAG: ABC transporter permease [Actinomycetota bacterium]|nr:ABC transporter permease [Actinomycetota bacterium]MDP9474789.1 ABC transporter permease [Actinomycetota bacterium]